MINDIDNISRSTWAAPNGDRWVFHEGQPQDRAPIADVYNARGELIGRVIPLSDSRVVGYAAERVYLVRSATRANAA
jgi:hypothetical protein